MTNRRETQAGMTLIEVIIAVAVLAIAMAGVFGAIMICFQLNSRAREDSIALSAAEDMLTQIRNTVYEDVVATYENMTFRVEGLAPPSPGVDHGEVIIIRSELPDESVYGRDLELPAGPDGVDLNGDGDTFDVYKLAAPDQTFPLDLDRKDGPVLDDVLPENMKVIPVVVLVRWQSAGGMARMQLMSVVVDRDGL